MEILAMTEAISAKFNVRNAAKSPSQIQRIGKNSFSKNERSRGGGHQRVMPPLVTPSPLTHYENKNYNFACK